ncbi:MAG: glycosyltransferase family 39 protein [Christensenellales bacterium]
MLKKKWKWLFPVLTVLLLAGLLLVALRPGEQVAYGVNLLRNADFELVSGEGLPEDWLPDAYLNIHGVSSFEVVDGSSGKGILVRNNEANDARFTQIVQVVPNTVYELSGRIKAEVLTGRGASLGVMQVSAVSGSVLDTAGGWQEIKVYGRTGPSQRELTVYARVGGYSADSIGEASFDDLALVAVPRVPEDAVVDAWEPWAFAAADEADTADAAPAPFWPWLLLISGSYLLFAHRGAAQAERRQLEAEARGKVPLWGKGIAGLLLAALLTRLILAALVPGYGVDIACFTGWANHMYAVGPARFYITEGFSDYPPGYMLALWPLGWLGSLMGGTSGFLVKLPPIICDLLAVALLYRFCARHMKGRSALLITAIYAFSPLVYVTGAAWGQADSVPALLLMLVILSAFEGKWSLALPLYVLSILMKPQALMFGPLGLLALIIDLLRGTRQKRLSALIGLGASLLVAAAVVLPFQAHQAGLDWLIKLYSGTMNYYGYATVNATNLHFLFGLNWQPVGSAAPFLLRLVGGLCLIAPVLLHLYGKLFLRKHPGSLDAPPAAAPLERLALLISLLPALAVLVVPMTLSLTGILLMVSSFLLLSVRYAAQKDIRNLPLLGAVMLVLFCTLGAMMHERYLFTALLLLMMAYALRRDRRIFWLLCALSITVFLNVGIVLDRGIRIGGVEGHLDAPNFGIVSDSAWLEYLNAALSVLVAGFALYVGLGQSKASTPPQALRPAAAADAPAQTDMPSSADHAARRLLHPAPRDSIRLRDWLLVALVTALYGVLALSSLGSLKGPQRGYTFTQPGEEAVFDLGSQRDFHLLQYGGIHWRPSDYLAESSADMITWTGGPSQMRGADSGDCFSWKYQKESSIQDGSTVYSGVNLSHHGRYLRISAPTVGLTLLEIIARDAVTGENIPLKLISGSAAALIDEQDTLEGEPSWYNSMYFDEIYHGRTAYEQLNAMRGLEPNQIYETSHPPLGKLLMSGAIAIFGMVPYGWRFAGALAGVLMLPGIYLLGRLLTGRHSLGLAAMLLLAFDFMHFAQTRIATIDGFATLFIIWSYYFMFRYALADASSRPLRKTLPDLALSGLFMGLAIASKWTGMYAGLGLAAIFFWALWRRAGEGMAARRLIRQPGDLPAQRAAAVQRAATQWERRTLITLLWCLLFFLAVPALIYYLSFLPVFMQTPGGLSVQKVIDASTSMFRYHATPGLGMDHPFYSPWYQWPLSLKPMWFYAGSRTDGTGSTIMTFGNPVIWWGGFLALLIIIGAFFKQHLRRGPLRLSRDAREDDIRPGLLILSFSAQYLPWVLVPRGTYIYHYFPSVPFIILCTVLTLSFVGRARPKAARWVTLGIVVLAGLFFIAFFPYISGLRVSIGWLEALRWFPGWIYY